jgi:hypothetical protein
MPKKRSPLVLPHLTPEEISDRDYEELRLSRELSKCSQRGSFDSERAFHVLRAHAVEIFNVVYPAYRRKSGFKPKWVPEIVRDVAYRTLRVYSGHESYGTMPTMNDLFESLFDTLEAHLEELKGTEPQTATAATPALGAGLQTVDFTERIALRDSYRASFPDSGILDICFAARQHYREWTRWLKGELKNGSKPDRQFCSVLNSGRDAKGLRKEIRPKNWK